MKNYLMFALLAALCTSVSASDKCPTPPPPTCEQRIARAKAAGCNLMSDPVIIQTECADCPQCPEPAVVKIKDVVYQDVPFAVHDEPRGHALFGGGPVYFPHFDRVGGTLVGGYAFAGKTTRSGFFQILGGPFYMPASSVGGVSGSVSNCGLGGMRNDHDSHCVTLPYTTPAVPVKSSYGGTLLALWAF